MKESITLIADLLVEEGSNPIPAREQELKNVQCYNSGAII